jgi:long-chain acyl-CoA synthetase
MTHRPDSFAEAHAQLTGPGSLFEIEETLIRGIPTRVWKHAPPSLRSVLERSRDHGDKTFLVYEDERTSFEEHFVQAAGLARVMVEEWGIRPGDRVAIAMRNFPEWSVGFWAATAAGAIAVPLNAWWKTDELCYGLFEDVVAAAPRDGVLPQVELGPEDDATIFYTSGTTGNPKGALGTHRNICGNLVSLAFAQARGALRSGQTPAGPGGAQSAQLVSVPFFHATGCHSVLCGNTAFGGKLVMMYKWDPERAIELIERERITSFGGVPSMVWQLLESPSFATHDLSSVKSVAYGGAPAAPDLVRRIKEAFPDVAPGNGYGLTETSSITTFNAAADYEAVPDSVGAAVPVCELKVVDEGGRELASGEVGELWIKGPNVVRGYWNKPAETAAAFSDGWLHSGDLARVDEAGFVYIVDRAKDMLIRGGENVYCVEVESVLYDHPDVMDAAVVGLPHRVLGEEVGAVVQVTGGATVTEAELRDHVAAKLAAFKVPVRIELRTDPLPRNANGKILKAQLKDELAASSNSPS